MFHYDILKWNIGDKLARFLGMRQLAWFADYVIREATDNDEEWIEKHLLKSFSAISKKQYKIYSYDSCILGGLAYVNLYAKSASARTTAKKLFDDLIVARG